MLTRSDPARYPDNSGWSLRLQVTHAITSAKSLCGREPSAGAWDVDINEAIVLPSTAELESFQGTRPLPCPQTR